MIKSKNTRVFSDSSSTDPVENQNLNTVNDRLKVSSNRYEITKEQLKTSRLIYYDIGIPVIAMMFYLGDVIYDMYMAVKHYSDENYMFCMLTVSFIVIPLFVTTAFSLIWYLVDDGQPVLYKNMWRIRIVFLTFQMAALLRIIDSVYLASKIITSEGKQKKCFLYKKMIQEATDARFLSLIESFMEAAPQLLLIIYIFAQSHLINQNPYAFMDYVQLCFMVLPLITMSWAFTSYQDYLRKALGYKKKQMLKWSFYVHLLWHFFGNISRLTAMGLFASVLPSYFFFLCAVHFVIMFTWLVFTKTRFCIEFGASERLEYFYKIILAILNMFYFMNPTDDRTRYRYTFFYLLVFLENSIMMGIWFTYNLPHRNFLLPFQVLTFCFSLGIMVTYYTWFHPKTITCCTANTDDITVSKDSGTTNGEGLTLKENCASVNGDIMIEKSDTTANGDAMISIGKVYESTI